VEEIASTADAERVAARALATVSAPMEIAGEEHELHASVGVAVIDYRKATPEAHLRHANLALHRAKEQPKSSYAVYDPSMDATLEERVRTERELRRGIESGEVVPYYQPIVELTTGRIVKFEALARWRHPTRGMVAPLQFIPVAEEGGLIEELTDSLLEQVSDDTRDWPRGIAVAVNLSPVLFESGTYQLRLAAFLDRRRVDRGRLELEITERALEADIGVARSFIDQLRGLGVRFSLDDFGTGYSSLSRLQKLRFDALKIDASFTQSMMHNPDASVIVRSIIELGRGLNMDLTAEGVETPEQHEALIAEGCDHAQGYLFGRPVPAAEATEMLQALRRTPQLATDDYGRRTVAER
jgi:predicted signal transduction protein with EAL and GGDEF domain